MEQKLENSFTGKYFMQAGFELVALQRFEP
jgi:hypothetical protein